MEGHFAASALRISATDDPILILQDTTEFSFKRTAPEQVGFTGTSCGRKMKDGRQHSHTICGMRLHVGFAITPEGHPLGLTVAKLWSRDKLKGTKAPQRKINPTRVPIEQKESMRWLDNMRLSTELSGAPERCFHIHQASAGDCFVRIDLNQFDTQPYAVFATRPDLAIKRRITARPALPVGNPVRYIPPRRRENVRPLVVQVCHLGWIVPASISPFD